MGDASYVTIQAQNPFKQNTQWAAIIQLNTYSRYLYIKSIELYSIKSARSIERNVLDQREIGHRVVRTNRINTTSIAKLK